MRIKRLHRVSLRVALLLLTLICILMGLVVSRARRQSEAVEQLKDQNALVFYEFENDYPAPRGRQLSHVSANHFANVLGIDHFYSVNIVKLYGTNSPRAVTDSNVMPWLRDLPDLQAIVLDGTEVTNHGLQSLSRHKRLWMLSLEGTRLNEEDVDHLRSLPLAYLNVAQTRFSDKSLASLHGMQSLKQLYLRRTKVSDAGLPTIATLSNLRILDLRRCLVTQAGFERIAAQMPNCEIQWELLKVD